MPIIKKSEHSNIAEVLKNQREKRAHKNMHTML